MLPGVQEDPTPTPTARTRELQVLRTDAGQFVLRVGDEVRACSERELPEALRQSLGLAVDDALALAAAVRRDARPQR
jgi:hypothetical protein